MANILSQEELDALLKEMKQLREDESKDSDIHINPTPRSSTTSGKFQDSMANQQSPVNLEVTLEIPIKLSAELGRAYLSVHEILQLTQGSMIELNNKAKGPLNLMIKDHVIAHGEVYVKDEKFALNLSQVDPVQDRLSKANLK
jgi:flagellar motor switch protein FliN/FliY